MQINSYPGNFLTTHGDCAIAVCGAICNIGNRYETSHRRIIDLWDERNDFAKDAGVSARLVSCWYFRQRIPNDYWPVLIKQAQSRKTRLTFDDFYRDQPAQTA